MAKGGSPFCVVPHGRHCSYGGYVNFPQQDVSEYRTYASYIARMYLQSCLEYSSRAARFTALADRLEDVDTLEHSRLRNAFRRTAYAMRRRAERAHQGRLRMLMVDEAQMRRRANQTR